jgi:hypothetical protein
VISRDQVLHALSRHIGSGNGVPVALLVMEITFEGLRNEADERRVRALVSELREEGVAICAHPSRGYYIAECPEDLLECCRFLRARAMHSLVLESRLRKIPLPELLGQLRLKT